MTEHKFTDEEIKKGLEICASDGYTCDECLYLGKGSCRQSTKDALDLINRYEAEIEALEYTLAGVMHSVDKWLDGEELEQDEVNRAITMREKTLQIAEKKQAEIERLTVNMNAFGLGMRREKERADTAKAEAIKEFAERLKASTCEFGSAKGIQREVDTLVKEMTEEQK